MKRSLTFILLLIFLAFKGVSAQKLTENGVKKMLQGLWSLAGNDSVTIAISGDSLIEYKLGDKEIGVYDCKLSHKPCDNEEFTPSPTGLYFNIGADEEDGLCAALKTIDGTHFILILDKETTVMFEKMQ